MAEVDYEIITAPESPDWQRAKESLEELGKDELLNDTLALLFAELAPIEMTTADVSPEEDKEEAVHYIKEVLQADLDLLREGSYEIVEQNGTLICMGIQNPQTEAESRAAVHAVRRLGETELLYRAGFGIA